MKSLPIGEFQYFLSLQEDDSIWSAFFSEYVSPQVYVVAAALASIAIPILVSVFFAILIGWSASMIALGRAYMLKTIGMCSMFGLYGVTVGFIIGSSTSSIAKDGLSGLITIVSALIGIVIAKEVGPRLKAIMPSAIICLLISLLFTISFFARINRVVTSSPSLKPENIKVTLPIIKSAAQSIPLTRE